MEMLHSEGEGLNFKIKKKRKRTEPPVTSVGCRFDDDDDDDSERCQINRAGMSTSRPRRNEFCFPSHLSDGPEPY